MLDIKENSISGNEYLAYEYSKIVLWHFPIGQYAIQLSPNIADSHWDDIIGRGQQSIHNWNGSLIFAKSILQFESPITVKFLPVIGRPASILAILLNTMKHQVSSGQDTFRKQRH